MNLNLAPAVPKPAPMEAAIMSKPKGVATAAKTAPPGTAGTAAAFAPATAATATTAAPAPAPAPPTAAAAAENQKPNRDPTVMLDGTRLPGEAGYEEVICPMGGYKRRKIGAVGWRYVCVHKKER